MIRSLVIAERQKIVDSLFFVGQASVPAGPVGAEADPTKDILPSRGHLFRTKSLMRRCILLGALVLFLALIASNASAFGIAPQYSTLMMQPGESQKIKIAVLQSNSRETEISLIPSHCLIDPDGRLIFSGAFSDLKLKAAEANYSAVPFMRSEKTRTRFDEWKEVTMTISVPSGTPAGEYYAAIIMKPSDLGSFLIVAVNPKALKTEGRISSIETKWIDDQLVIDAILENSGSRVFSPLAKAVIKRGEKVIDSVSLDMIGRNYGFVPHGNTRRMRGTLQNILPVEKNYTAEVIVTYGQGSKIALAKEFSVDRTAYTKQKGFRTLQVDPSATNLAIPPSGFYLLPLSIKNIDASPVSVQIFASDSWARPATSQITLEPEEAKTVPLSLFVPRVLERIDTKIIFVPSRGRPYESLITVYPKTSFE